MSQEIIFINSHPIQYFTPLYAYMNREGLQTSAWYCSDKSIKGGMDKEFGVNVKWDIPLLEGYNYRFFDNYSFLRGKNSGFFSLINLKMIVELFKIEKSVIIVHGWNYFSHFFVILLGRLRGHTICIRNDMPLNHEKFKKGWPQYLKRFGLKYLLFPRINFYLFIGEANRLFYKSYSLPDKKLLFCPYAVDNHRFQNVSIDIERVKLSLGIPYTDKIILFSGKYIEKKRPMDLLKAFKAANIANCWLIMMGEGNLRFEMESFIKLHELKNIILTGFVNQSSVTEYYAIANLFIMCSSLGENWGLSVNEAMNFDLPIIVSDLTGCADDLVINGVNGYVFETGDIDALAHRMRDVLVEKKLSWAISSKEIVANYSYDVFVKNIKKIL